MGGKEREREPPPATDDEDATQATTQEGDHAGRRRAGVIRQAQPTAQHHQITAGLASGAKRRAAAMSQGERATKRHCRRCDLLDELCRPLIRCCHWKKRITAVAVVTFPNISIFITADSSSKMMPCQMDYVKYLTSPTLY
jgi:hypothetical protein